MIRESLKGFLQIGFFIMVAGLCSALLVPRDSGEFVISVCSSVIGLTLVVGVVTIFRLMR
ncbi:MAG: hypothetical protein EA396_00770 [Anaerolineaceae bacterium]|nr:MAG: hypothetical protein EA396_00770 [Anaerolineaceae bacterium]